MNVLQTLVVPASPDAVWAIAGDVTGVPAWIPTIDSVRMEGDVRHAVFAGGAGEGRERITEHDDAGRTYVYEYIDGPMEMASDVSRVTVLDHADGAEVLWAADFTAGSPEADAELATAISGIYRTSLAELALRVAEAR